MSTANRIRTHALAAAVALLCAAGGAGAQCLITGATSLCDGPATLCGPDGTFEYFWTDPAGNTSFDRCLTATTPGDYTLQIFDMFGGSFACTASLAAPEPPPCGITGPATACEGSTVELSGPQGDFAYEWSGPNGFTASTAAIQVSAGGTYTLGVRLAGSSCPGSTCTHTVTFETCGSPSPNCPRPASFWMRGCLANERSELHLDPQQLAEMAARVDAAARIFDWPSASAGFCATLHPRHATLRARAKRQFAAVEASVCAGEMGMTSPGNQAIALDPATQVQLRGGAGTVGEWLASADAALVDLESRDRGRPAVKEAYRSIIRAGWKISHGRGIGPVCGHPAEDEDDDAAQLDPESGDESLAAELADDEADQPGVAARAMPNPFSATTTVTYVVSGSAPQEVAIAVYDLSGRMVRELARGSQAPGVHEARWDGVGANGARVRSGVYFVRGVVGNQRIAGQLTVLR
ncbi:MAG TPA: FlgD immunoglobulin-like domain containing protein [Candidatus Eisenbacteria bacterium]|jgi:hypothetical protein